MMSSEIENAIAANVIVAPATVLSTTRALATVEVTPSGRSAPRNSSRLSIQIVTTAPTMPMSTPTTGTKNRLTRIRSLSELSRRRIRPVWHRRHPCSRRLLRQSGSEPVELVDLHAAKELDDAHAIDL